MLFHVPAGLRQRPGNIPVRHRTRESTPSPVPPGRRADRAVPPTSTRTSGPAHSGADGPGRQRPPGSSGWAPPRRSRPGWSSTVVPGLCPGSSRPADYRWFPDSSRAPRASTATRMPSRGASTLAPVRSERSVRISTCRAPAVRDDPSRRVKVTVPRRQNRVSKCRGSSWRGRWKVPLLQREQTGPCAGHHLGPVSPIRQKFRQQNSAPSPSVCIPALYRPNSPFFSQGSFRISPTS